MQQGEVPRPAESLTYGVLALLFVFSKPALEYSDAARKKAYLEGDIARGINLFGWFGRPVDLQTCASRWAYSGD